VILAASGVVIRLKVQHAVGAHPLQLVASGIPLLVHRLSRAVVVLALLCMWPAMLDPLSQRDL
jgi:hypothetical protein